MPILSFIEATQIQTRPAFTHIRSTTNSFTPPDTEQWYRSQQAHWSKQQYGDGGKTQVCHA